ncbi:glycoprotein precursor [Scadoxus chlorotic ringspot virus]|nr:glycoprotein precursor [Scadoxus chlorotic ringspot virus]
MMPSSAPLLYCSLVLLLYFIAEVTLLGTAGPKSDDVHDAQFFRDRYNPDDPDDLVETKEEIEEQTVSSSVIPSRIPRDTDSTTVNPTEKSDSSLSCETFNKKDCLIRGVSDFNAHYQISDGSILLACITDSERIFDSCLYEKQIKKKDFLKIPVVPVMKITNKRVLEVGTKFYFVDDKNDPINIDPRSGISGGIVSKLSVRFSGDCKLEQVSFSSPYSLKIRSSEPIGYAIKNTKDPKVLEIKTTNGDSSMNLDINQLDGNHFLLCGDKSSYIKKVDVPTRNCVARFSDEPKKIFFCINFPFFKWIFVTIVIFFPVTWLLWKTKRMLFLWYDIMGIVTYPILLLLNYLWLHFPLKCKICGNFSFLTHECSKLCVCSQSEASKSHSKECFLFSKNADEWEKLSLIDRFQFTINTKISASFLIFLTKIIIATILISYLPSSLAENQMKNVCIDKCHFSLDLLGLTMDKDGLMESTTDTCKCSIGDIITETIYREGIPISRNAEKNNCLPGSRSCSTGNQARDLFSCRYGCNALKAFDAIPDTIYAHKYRGTEYKKNLTSLKIANRLRQGFIDDRFDVIGLESVVNDELTYFTSLKIDDIPPENLMSRQPLVFSALNEGKYRYLIETDMKADTGTIFLLNEDSSHSPMEFMVYIKSVGVEYDIRYKYSTSKIDTTVTDYLVTCTGNCDDCVKVKKPYTANNFCISPTSWWGCEEVGCLAINEGAICGHCSNVFDLSTMVNIYQVVQSHLMAEICIKSFSGYSCKKHSDRVPIQTDYYQLDMTVDLHNDYMSTDKLFAVTKQQKILTGSIADFGDFSSRAFGHPQLSIAGTSASAQNSLSKDKIDWSCSAIGSKTVNIKQCGLITYNMINSLTPSKDYSIIDEENNKLYMKKDFLAGKIKMVVDMPKEMFQKVPSKPILTDSNVLCTGCYKCAIGLECSIEFVSDTTFSSTLKLEGCSFKSDQIGAVIGMNKAIMKLFCSSEIKDKTIKMIPEDQETLSCEIAINNVEIKSQDTIINYDDKSAHDENIHHSDTGIANLWDWIKAPFNWVASFFGNFFEFVRIILAILSVLVLIYILSYIYKLSMGYFREKRRIKTEKELDEIAEGLISKKSSDGTRKRATPPKTFDFPLDF